MEIKHPWKNWLPAACYYWDSFNNRQRTGAKLCRRGYQI